MHKRVVLKVGPGSPQTGYEVSVQIGAEQTTPQVETHARLSVAPDLPDLYHRWQQSYWQLGTPYRIKANPGVTNVSAVSDFERCRSLSRDLRDRVHHWLNEDAFRPIREKILEQLSPQDTTRILLQTKDPLLQRLPWYELHFFERYRQAEVGICAPNYQQVSGTRSQSHSSGVSRQVRILAIFGNGLGLDTQTDRDLLEQLGADIHCLEQPSRETFNRNLWDEKGWDILFFAGHSSSSGCTEGNGEIFLNATDKLTIPQLKHALKKAIDRGLNTAIFNSCDGLGLAADISDLHIPQVLVMREPVPDRVAHAFLQGFLTSFSSGHSFYISVREAREKLQGLEAQFPCATWLPVIVQNLAEIPPTWRSLKGESISPLPLTAAKADAPTIKPNYKRDLKAGLGTGAVIATLTIAVRLLGLLAPLELKAYDLLLKSRPPDLPDRNLLIVTNTDQDIDNYTAGDRSLSDETLLALLNKINAAEPALIGLDIYRDYPAEVPALAQQIKSNSNFVTICKVKDYTVGDRVGTAEKSPPPEISPESHIQRVGFSDFVSDKDEIVRRHLMQMETPSSSRCQSATGFSTLLAYRYVYQIKKVPSKDKDYFGKTRIPYLARARTTSNFGSYRNIDSQGDQVMLNYRMLSNSTQANCGEVQETPADCITVSEVLKDDSDLSAMKGRIVLIGTTAPGADAWSTPWSTTTPGVFLQAQMVSQLVAAGLGERSLISSWQEWQEMLWIAAWAIAGGAIGAAGRQVGQRTKLWLWLLIGEGLLVLTCWLWLAQGAVWVPLIPSAIALPLSATAAQTIRKLSAS